MENYKEFRKRQQEEVNALPMYWAYSENQWIKLLNELGLTEEQAKTELSGYIGNSIVRKKDIPYINEVLSRHSKELKEAMNDLDFFKEAAFFEMCNHEYGINWQADYDVINALGFNVRYSDGDELDECKMSDDQKRVYREARREYYKAAEEKGWF